MDVAYNHQDQQKFIHEQSPNIPKQPTWMSQEASKRLVSGL